MPIEIRVVIPNAAPSDTTGVSEQEDGPQKHASRKIPSNKKSARGSVRPISAPVYRMHTEVSLPLCFSLSLSLCLSVSVSVSLSLSISLSVCLSLILCVFVCVCVSVCLCVCVCVFARVCMSVCLRICLSLCCYACMLVCLHTCVYIRICDGIRQQVITDVRSSIKTPLWVCVCFLTLMLTLFPSPSQPTSNPLSPQKVHPIWSAYQSSCLSRNRNRLQNTAGSWFRAPHKGKREGKKKQPDVNSIPYLDRGL